jgi:hypothetical protein
MLVFNSTDIMCHTFVSVVRSIYGDWFIGLSCYFSLSLYLSLSLSLSLSFNSYRC